MYALPYILLYRLQRAALNARRQDRTWKFFAWSLVAGTLAALLIMAVVLAAIVLAQTAR